MGCKKNDKVEISFSKLVRVSVILINDITRLVLEILRVDVLLQQGCSMIVSLFTCHRRKIIMKNIYSEIKRETSFLENSGIVSST